MGRPACPAVNSRKDRGLGGCLAIGRLDPRAGSPESVPGESRENGRPGEGVGSRRRPPETDRREGGASAPLPGPVDEIPAWRCLAGREGGRPNAGKGVALQGGAS